MEFTGIFQYGAIFNKMTFSNINLQNKALLILVLVFAKVKKDQFKGFIEVKISMSPNKEVFKFLTILSPFSYFFVFI